MLVHPAAASRRRTLVVALPLKPERGRRCAGWSGIELVVSVGGAGRPGRPRRLGRPPRAAPPRRHRRRPPTPSPPATCPAGSSGPSPHRGRPPRRSPSTPCWARSRTPSPARRASEDRLRRFVADASHELRTPLTSIRGYAELFRQGAADRPEDLAMAMRRIEEEATRMGGLVDDLLLLARLDQGRPLERVPVDLARLAADAVADARAVDPDRPAHARDRRRGRPPAGDLGDEARLRQVAANLLANAARPHAAGTPVHVRVLAERRPRPARGARRGPRAGAGAADRVFERFFRADPPAAGPPAAPAWACPSWPPSPRPTAAGPAWSRAPAPGRGSWSRCPWGPRIRPRPPPGRSRRRRRRGGRRAAATSTMESSTSACQDRFTGDPQGGASYLSGPPV